MRFLATSVLALAAWGTPVFAEEFNFSIESEFSEEMAGDSVLFNQPKMDGYSFLANTAEELSYVSYPGYSSTVILESQEMKQRKTDAITSSRKAMFTRGTQACDFLGYPRLVAAFVDTPSFKNYNGQEYIYAQDQTFVECLSNGESECIWVAQSYGPFFLDWPKSQNFSKETKQKLLPLYFSKLRCSK